MLRLLCKSRRSLKASKPDAAAVYVEHREPAGPKGWAAAVFRSVQRLGDGSVPVDDPLASSGETMATRVTHRRFVSLDNHPWCSLSSHR